MLIFLSSHFAAILPISSIDLTDGELAVYFADFAGESWDAAPKAMREAISFLVATLVGASRADQWAVLFIG